MSVSYVHCENYMCVLIYSAVVMRTPVGFVLRVCEARAS